MGILRLLPASAFRRMPWKNGGGETVEIAVFPAQAGLDGFDWRISMATVAVDGPFSLFSGIDRTLAILTGAGLMLGIDGAGPVRLQSGDVPLSFPADVPVDARLIDGPITDLNAMTRRGRFRHRLSCHRIERAISIRIDAGLAVLLPQNGELHVNCCAEAVTVAAGDALMVETGQGVSVGLKANVPASLHLVELWSDR